MGQLTYVNEAAWFEGPELHVDCRRIWSVADIEPLRGLRATSTVLHNRSEDAPGPCLMSYLGAIISSISPPHLIDGGDARTASVALKQNLTAREVAAAGGDPRRNGSVYTLEDVERVDRREQDREKAQAERQAFIDAAVIAFVAAGRHSTSAFWTAEQLWEEREERRVK